MASQQNKTLHSVVMNFIPKKVASNNPPIIKTSLPNLDKSLANETIKLTYDNICNVILKEDDLKPPTQQPPALAPRQAMHTPQQPKPIDNPVKTTNLLEPGQTTLDNYVSVSVTKVQPKRLTKSAKVSAVKHELTVSPQTAYRRKHPVDNKPIPVPANTKPLQPIQGIKESIQPSQQPKSTNSVLHRGRTFDDDPVIYRGKNPFHEITLKAKKTKKSKKLKKKSKKSKKKSKKKEKRVYKTQSLSSGGNARESISNDIQNMMSFF
jgi:hypothetical protein